MEDSPERRRKRIQRRWLLLLAVALTLPGCTDAPYAPDVPQPPTPLGAAFDPQAAGSIAGRVTWDGPVPEVPVLTAHANYLYPIRNQFVGEKPNPHAPLIDRKSRGIRHAVVFLHKVDPVKSRPWHHIPPRIAVRSRTLYVTGQGGETSRIGFVRRGEQAEFVNEDIYYHLLHGRGAAFFALPFVAANRPTPRRFDRIGIVDLSAGAGQFWMGGHLFVDEHPYYALTDADGRFELTQVPEGEYALRAWLPNWHIDHVEREPEVGLISRLVFRPPVTKSKMVRVERGTEAAGNFEFRARDFEP